VFNSVKIALNNECGTKQCQNSIKK